LQNTTAYDLYDSALYRLAEICRMGTGAVEIKSGYGLSLEAEIKMLRVIQQLKAASPLTIKATFLGAHALPIEYKNNREGYINLLINQMLPQIADEGLADFIDVFCEQGFFTADETAKILTAGAKYGLRAKIHANQLYYSGGVQVGVQHNALSVDHLECVGDAEIDCLLNSQTMPTLLPSAAFFLNLPYQPARRMIDAGLPIALATDYNPGSSPSGNMPFVISLACTQMKMLPNEAINAATLNSAYAMDVAPNLGSIARNKIANIQIINAPSVAYIPYSFGSQLTQTVILNGKVI
jgi:imidazolonepropionase